MKRPSFQFYPGDWSANPNLKRCTFAERGIWLEVICLLHDQPEYGVLRWPLKEIAQAVGCKPADLLALERKGVLKGHDTQLAEPFVYVPRSGRKDGEPVTLIDTQAGPIWYSSRMVKDEYVRANAGASTRFGAREAPPTPPRKSAPGTDRAKLRARVSEKTNGHCYHCEKALGEVWEIDHLMPRSKGGRHTFANLVPSCVPCNQDKSDTLPDDWEALGRSPTRRDGEGRSDGSSSSSSSSSSKNTPNPSPGFAEFWAAYPRKDAKADALKAWAKLKPDEPLRSAMHAALTAQRESEGWRKERGRFIPLPASWLNGRRWEDGEGSACAEPDFFAGAE